MKRKEKGCDAPLHQAQFDALPYSVQRKYFSSLERLQIQQQAFDQPTSGRSSRASSSTPFRPSLTLSSRRRARKSEHALHAHDVSQADVEFFLSLPEKLRRQHFSRQEQDLLLGKSKQAHQHLDDFRFDFSKTDGTPTRGRPRTASSASSSSSSSVNSSRPLCLPFADEKDPNRASSLLYLDIMAPSFPIKKAPPASAPRRAMSLSSPPVRYPASAAVLMIDSPLFTMVPTPRHERAHSSSLSGRRSSHTPAAPVFDPEATHYQDPEARKKLRTYLASPQKFDEAIEFGFPSSTGNDAATPHYQLPPITGHARKFSRDMHSFLKGGQLSFLDDKGYENQGLESDAEDSVADTDSPVTPSSTAPHFPLHARHVSQPKYSMESNGQSNREMTLRMTLTRPDLRADDDQLYGWQSPGPKPMKDDPLALEDLVLTDDMTGTKGAFYIKPKPKGSLVTRLWKRASLQKR